MVRNDQFSFNRINISSRRNLSIDMNNIFIMEAPHDMSDGIDRSDMP